MALYTVYQHGCLLSGFAVAVLCLACIFCNASWMQVFSLSVDWGLLLIFSAHLPQLQHCIVSEQSQYMCVAHVIATCTSLAPIGLVPLTVNVWAQLRWLVDQVIHSDSVVSHVNQIRAHLISCAGASSEHKRRRVSSSYAERLRNLPSASQMSQIVMRQQQGCLQYNFHLQQPFLKGVTEPL